MKEELNSYVKFIRDFEKELEKKCQISNDFWNKSGIKFPKTGNTKSFKYSFHGAGCRVEKGEVVCEYDIAPLNDNDINFSLWKLFNYIETNPELENVDRKDLESGVKELEKEGVISKLFIDGIDTGLYEIPRSR